MFNFPIETSSEEETEVFEEVKKELLHEEMQWWLNEYEKFEMEDTELFAMEQDNVICPICQIANFKLINEHLSCSQCEISFKTEKSLDDIKKLILSNLELHSAVCSHEPQFNLIMEPSRAHVYLICESCSEMKLVI
ncbi:hypothetical protein K1T71_003871 [Dendrolimus kikuchii]|uniref:Uncharacterized protein n=1 Tax=Dendrolimus kikuchii TaxID=765133 RepID=A0ACC1D9D4_9NEOP|nr:hypothetical protein K1T71_003871 [Dendrolimus kikuchii]